MVADRRVLVALITILGGLLRLWNIQAAEYRGDDGDFMQTASGMVHQGQLLVGFTSSAGISSGAAGLYILSVPLLFSSSYTVAAAFTAILNAACIPLLYLIGRDLAGPRVGLIVALLAAVNPFLVVYGRRTWITGLVAPTAVLFLWSAVRALKVNTVPAWMLAGVGVAGTTLVHLSGIPNAFALALSALYGNKVISWPRLALGALVALGLMAPWLWGSLFPELGRFDFRREGSPASFVDNSFERATLLVTGVAYQSVAGQSARLLDATAPPFTWIDTLARFLSAVGWFALMGLVWSLRKQQPIRAVTALLVILMVALPIVALARPVQTGAFQTLYPYYLLNSLPGQLLGTSLLVSLIWSLFKPLAGGLIILVAGAQLLLAWPFFATQEEYWPKGDYGVPWKFQEQLASDIERVARSERAFVLVGGDEQDHSQHRLLAQALARTYDQVRTFDAHDGVVFRSDVPALLLVTTNDEHFLTRFLQEEFASAETVIQTLPGAPAWKRRVFQLTPAELDGWAQAHLGSPPESQSGQIIYERVKAEGRIVSTLWHLESDPQEPFLTRLELIRDGQLLHREEHVAYPASSWRPGDWLGTRMLNFFQLPEDVTLRPGTRVRLSHVHVLTGRAVAPPLEINVSSSLGR